MHKLILSVLVASISLVNADVYAYSSSFQMGIQQANAAAASGRQLAENTIRQFNPNSVYDKYNSTPTQSTLYTGVQESSADQMQQQANQAMNTSETAKTIITSEQTRPVYPVNLKTADMQRSLLIQSEADNIIRGVTNQYIDCQPKQACHFEYLQKSCLRSAMPQQPGCRKNLVVNVVGNTVTESWSGSCGYLEQLSSQGICHVKEEKCLLSNATKKINDVSVTRACWEKQFNYDCQIAATADDCAALDTAQCEQLNSICNKKVGDVCVSYQQSYRCPQNTCVNTANIVCGDGKDYCLNSDCSDHQYQTSKDFGRVLTAVSATNEEAKDFRMNSIFKGKPHECRDDAGNFSNCCQGSGWGQDMKLAHCSQEEKALGAAREKNMTVYAGRYCSSKFLGKCIEHKETYCVFPSKIAKVIQEQGRRGQLHISFGDGKHANCRGITPEQLQRINLSKIDFGKEIMDELGLKVKNPNQNATRQAINTRIQQFQQMGQSNE